MKNNSSQLRSFENDGAGWYFDRYAAVRIARNRYFILLIICFIALICSVIANLSLSPLKTAVPYVIEVNKANGTTSVLKPADINSIKENQNVTLYFLFKYLNARVGYNYGLRQMNAGIVRALSTRQVYANYASLVDTSNPQSPIRLYRDTSTIDVRIIGYSFPYNNIAQINFYTELNNPSNSSKQPIRQYWQATIKFIYATNPLPMSERININPLGFFVTDFQMGQQALPKTEM